MQILQRSGFLWAVAAMLLAGSTGARAADYAHVSETSVNATVPLFGALTLTDTVVQDGANPINRFTMHRLRKTSGSVRGVILLLPSLGNNFRSYLFSDNGDMTTSFAATFAWLGYEVWGYSSRETGILTGACGGALDCSPALHWSMQTIVDDVGYIRSRIAATTPGESVVVGGLSLGALSALAVVNQSPGAYNGLLAWEGSLVTDDAAIRAHNLPYCSQFSNLVAAGIAVDDQSLPFVKTVAELARTAPNAPFAIPVPGFPPGLTNRQAFVLILSTPNPVAPSPRPGFITAVGNVGTGSLQYSSSARLTANIALFNDVTSNRVGRDFYCSLAGVETAYSNNLKAFTAPVMIVKAGQGFGSIMDELPGKLGSTSVRSIGVEAYAHVDHLGSPLHWFALELPILHWLEQAVN
ncbi:MAG TPA: hypothetical protein VER03_16140 [Bryobacteraceae bacterium]|nr:hypothetical protein [Bryobacteraceae bacterium]